MITIFDYGAGNLRSVENTLAEIGAPYALVNNAQQLRRASKIILPGVGNFGQMMRAMDAMEVRQTFIDTIHGHVPFLGICLGLQALLATSEEAPNEQGFGIYPGTVQRFPEQARVPHMGWNEIELRAPSRLLAGIGKRPYLYFAHSYYVPEMPHTIAACTYAVPYTAALESGNVFGVQFHPEKSGPLGLKIMKNFADL